MKLVTLACLVAVGALSGAAGPASQAAIKAPGVDAAANVGANQCFKRRDVRNHTVGDNKTLYLDVDGRDVYRIEMSNSCLSGAVSSDPLIFNNQTGTQEVCKPMDLDITVTGAGPSKCIVSKIVRLTPSEVAALPKGMRP
jgi:hypothetical protein